jgi:hypothetical protein
MKSAGRAKSMGVRFPMLRSFSLGSFGLLGFIICVSACSSTSIDIGGGADAGSDSSRIDAACAPLPCPSGAPWDPVACACVATDGGQDSGQDACVQIPCPSFAPWDPSVCACVTIDAGGDACAPIPCGGNDVWDPSVCACVATDGGSPSVCTATGGTVTSALCCASEDAFPSTCGIGACACAPASSHTIDVCSCPSGKCFDPTQGCH